MAPKKDKTGDKPDTQETQNPVNEPPPEKQEKAKKTEFDQKLFTYHRDQGWIPVKEAKKRSIK